MTDLEAMIRTIVREEIEAADLRGGPARALTVREVAERLSVDQKTVRRLIERGELRGVRIGSRSIRILSRDVDALLAETTP